MGERTAFTIIEIILIIVITAILVALVLPNYYKAIEKNRAYHSQATLWSIYNLQKRYKLENGDYYVCNLSCNNTDIEAALGIDISDPYFTYEILRDDPMQGTGFKAIATRIDEGFCADKRMIINQEDSVIEKECPIW